MSFNSNPARRLHDLVLSVRMIKDRIPNHNNGHQALGWIVFAQAFGISNSDDKPNRHEQNQVMRCINEVHQLIDEVEQTIKGIHGIDLKKYLRPFPELRHFFPDAIRLNTNFQDNVSVKAMTDLEYCEDVIAGAYNEKVIDEDSLKEILTSITNLYEQIIDSDLNDELRKILLDMLMTMENAIHEYRIRGAGRLKEAIEKLIGIYMLNSEVIEKSDAESVKEVKDTLTKFVGLYSFAADSAQLLEAVGKYMPLLLVAGDKLIN